MKYSLGGYFSAFFMFSTYYIRFGGLSAQWIREGDSIIYYIVILSVVLKGELEVSVIIDF